MRPIPTEYGGVVFRSRLEACWAAYFDSIKAKWVYEPEGYQLRAGIRYLPDFYLLDIDTWFECKGPDLIGLPKAGYFVAESKRRLVLGFFDGRFFVAEDGGRYDGLLPCDLHDALIRQDRATIERYMALYSSLGLGDDGYYGFTNNGAESDLYCDPSQDPDGGNAVKDRDDGTGLGEVRTYYFSGMSTWRNRSFSPPRWKDPRAA